MLDAEKLGSYRKISASTQLSEFGTKVKMLFVFLSLCFCLFTEMGNLIFLSFDDCDSAGDDHSLIWETCVRARPTDGPVSMRYL